MATTNDKGVTGLLELLKLHPELVKSLVLDQAEIRKLLGGPGRRLLSGNDLTKFLEYMASPNDGYPIAFAVCGGATGGNAYFCAKGTAQIICGGATGGGNPTK